MLHRQSRLWPCRTSGLLSCFGGSSKHLDDLFERGSVRLDESSRVRTIGFGSGNGHGSYRWWGGWRLVVMVETIAVGAAASTAAWTVSASALRGWNQRWIMTLLESG